MNKILSLSYLLSQQDVKQAYRRSAIGPFWLTIALAVQIATIGIVFGLIFKSELQTYIPFLAVSIVFWNFIATSINEGALSFISSEAIIKQMKLPHLTFILRSIIRNVQIAGHNFVILPVVSIIMGIWPSWSFAAFLPGIVILILNLIWISWALALISTRYRDMPPIISSAMLVAFYITPVMWFPKLLDNSGLAHAILGFNPFYHLLQIVRLPILGEWPTWENWAVALLSAAIGWPITLFAHKKYKNMIPYWI